MSPDVFRLEPDEQKSLRGLDQKIGAVRDTIKKMKAIGLPVDDLEAQLESNVRLRDGMIAQFGNPVMPR